MVGVSNLVFSHIYLFMNPNNRDIGVQETPIHETYFILNHQDYLDVSRFSFFHIGVLLSLAFKIDRKKHRLEWESNPSVRRWLNGTGLRPLSYRDTHAW